MFNRDEHLRLTRRKRHGKKELKIEVRRGRPLLWSLYSGVLPREGGVRVDSHLRPYNRV